MRSRPQRKGSSHKEEKHERSGRESRKRRDSLDAHSYEPSYNQHPYTHETENRGIVRRNTEPLSTYHTDVLSSLPLLQDSDIPGPGTQGGISVCAESLQVTFENIISLINVDKGGSYSPESVAEMLRDVYSWMVFNPNLQITLPAERGSASTRKMWPHGSKVDTRAKAKDLTGELSKRVLKDLDKESTANVASSVISSTLEEDNMSMRKGSVMYSDSNSMITKEPMTYGDHDNMGRSYHYSRPFNFEHNPPVMYGNVHPRIPQTVHESYDGSSLNQRRASRFTIAGATVPPPDRVEETPQPAYVAPVKVGVKKRTRVGAAPRTQNAEDEGTPVVWAE